MTAAPLSAARPALRIAVTLALATLAALAAQALAVPLPWMIGPLAVTALAGLAGWPLAASNRLRNAGQWAIGVALGLYFTPEVVAMLPALGPAVAVGVVWALALGHGFYRLLWRHGGLAAAPGSGGRERATAFFAAAIGGASEMAVLADRHGGRVDLVAAAHSLRVLIVVVALPVALQASGVRGSDLALPALQQVHPAGLALLAAATVAGALLLRRLGAPNPWVLGALAVSAALTASDLRLSALPRPLTDAGQLLIGVALGVRFTPDFLHAAPRWLACVAAGTVGMLVLSAAFAFGLATLASLHPATVLLGTSPGGIAEMCITAKGLQLGVPVVTAFHVVRYVAVLTLTPALFGLELRRRAR